MHYNNQSGLRKNTTFLQLVLFAMAIVNVVVVSNNIDNKHGLSLLNQILSWITSGNNLIFNYLTFQSNIYK